MCWRVGLQSLLLMGARVGNDPAVVLEAGLLEGFGLGWVAGMKSLGINPGGFKETLEIQRHTLSVRLPLKLLG